MRLFRSWLKPFTEDLEKAHVLGDYRQRHSEPSDIFAPRVRLGQRVKSCPSRAALPPREGCRDRFPPHHMQGSVQGHQNQRVGIGPRKAPRWFSSRLSAFKGLHGRQNCPERVRGKGSRLGLRESSTLLKSDNSSVTVCQSGSRSAWVSGEMGIKHLCRKLWSTTAILAVYPWAAEVWPKSI